MLKLVSFVSFLFLLVSAGAQNHHFVYFESQNNKPFFIKYDNKIFTSTKKNYINISKLNSGDILIKVDIDNEKDLSFTVPLNENDGGYILKQNADNDWVLFNILDFTTLVQDKFIEKVVTTNQPIIIQPTTTIEATKTIEPTIEIIDSNKQINISQSSLVPKAVLLDSTKTLSPLIKQEIVISDSILSKKENIELKLDEENSNKKSTIEKIHQAQMLTGIEQKFIEKNGDLIDTISIFIPFKKTINIDTVKEISRPFVEEKKMESKNLDVTHLDEVNCPALATEFDYNNFITELQKNPVIKNKLAIAFTVLQKKCYTTSQIQKLSVMFMYDKAKLDFFKMAINSVADIKNFHYLENEIKDESMKQEFLDLLKRK